MLLIETTTGLPCARTSCIASLIVSEATAEPPPRIDPQHHGLDVGPSAISPKVSTMSSAAISVPNEPLPRRIRPAARTSATLAAGRAACGQLPA